MPRVESLETLRKICQKPNYRTAGNWMVRYIVRDLALPITKILLYTPITANQVTVLAMIVAGVGGILMALGTPFLFFCGTLGFQLSYLLDHVDGQIARYYKTSSLEGRFFDFVMHHFISFLGPFCIGFGLSIQMGSFLWVALGFIATLSMVMMGLLNDSQTKAIYEKIVENREDLKLKRMVPLSHPTLSRSVAKKFFSLLHKSCEGHVFMNVITLFGFIYWVFEINGTKILIVYYAGIATVVWCFRLFWKIHSQKISGEFNQLFCKL